MIAILLVLLATAYSLQPTACFAQGGQATVLRRDPLTMARLARGFPGANAGAQIAAAIADLPPTGGTVDARGFEGAHTVTADIFSSVTKPVRLLLGAISLTTAFTGAAQCAFGVGTDNVTLEGQGAVTQIILGRSDDRLICVGDGVAERRDITIRHLKLKGLALPCCESNKEVGIHLHKVTRFSVDNVDFENLATPLEAITSRDGTISNLRIDGTTFQSVYISQQSAGDYGRIALSNIVSTNQQPGSMGLRITGFGAVIGGKVTANGLVFQGVGHTTAEGIVIETAEHVAVDGAVISNMGIGIGLQANSRYNTISNVDVYGPSDGAADCLTVGESGTVASDNQFSHMRCRSSVPGLMTCIQNLNYGSDRNKYEDISCLQTGMSIIDSSSDITLSGGLMDGVVSTPGQGALRIYVAAGVPLARIKVRGLTIRKPSSIGIQPIRTTFSEFSGNTISDCSQGGTNSNGIQDDADAMHNLYTGNTVLNTPAKNVTDATNDSPIVVTVANHQFISGDAGTIAAVTGNTAANGNWVLTVVDRDTFSLDGSTGNGAYTGGGTAKYRYGCNNGIALFGPYNTIGGNDLTTTPGGLYVDASSTNNKYVVTTDSNYVAIADAPLAASQLIIGQGAQHVTGLGDLGTTTQVLHGNAAGLPSFGAVQAADLAITVAIPDAALGINQLLIGQNTNHLTGLGTLGTTTTVLHGNASGPASFGAVDLGADVTGTLPDGKLPSSMANKTLTGTTTVGTGGSGITQHLSVTTGWNPPSLADGASTGGSVTVTGAAVGDVCIATHDQIGVNDVMISCVIGAASTARLVLLNRTGGTYDIASGTLRVDVWKH